MLKSVQKSANTSNRQHQKNMSGIRNANAKLSFNQQKFIRITEDKLDCTQVSVKDEIKTTQTTSKNKKLHEKNIS